MDMKHMTHENNKTGMDMGMDMDMPMYFHGGTMVTLFFKDWMTMSQKEFNGACVALFLVSALYEGLKVLRKLIVPGKRIQCSAQLPPAMSIKNRDYSTFMDTRETTTSAERRSANFTSNNNGPPTLQQRLIVHLIQTVLHIIQVFLGYLLMLAFMTYNSLVCVSILLGYGFGYLVFAWWTPMVPGGDGEDADCCNM
ncbi:high affinity copper uptake protein 1-like [Clytia hemisphaerica]|uniref:high affinity copper uptake protein 1-like n=1 Tax=Clytia hemisphaerica TaxID=252671 RepID=UPI0034D5EA49